MNHIIPTRRSVIGFMASLTALGSIAIASPAQARNPSSEADSSAPPQLSKNGWPVESASDAGGAVWARTIAGTAITIGVRIGVVETLFAHLIRRYHYEIDALREGDVVGFLPASASDELSNHRSGTAIDIRPSWYPKGSAGGYSKLDTETLNSILYDFEGLIAWGGHSDPVDESHFELVVGPEDERLAGLARNLAGWDLLPGNRIKIRG